MFFLAPVVSDADLIAADAARSHLDAAAAVLARMRWVYADLPAETTWRSDTALMWHQRAAAWTDAVAALLTATGDLAGEVLAARFRLAALQDAQG